jgi:hypothetical protein
MSAFFVITALFAAAAIPSACVRRRVSWLARTDTSCRHCSARRSPPSADEADWSKLVEAQRAHIIAESDPAL